MGKWQLADGERELLQELVTGARDGKRVPRSRLIVTDRRLVLVMPKQDFYSKLLGALFGKLAARMFATHDVPYQIRAHDFAEVEQQAGNMLVFHSKGEGYAHVSFEVYNASPLDVWQERMRAWVAGEVALQ